MQAKRQTLTTLGDLSKEEQDDIPLRRGFKQVARHQRLRQNESYHGWNQAGVNLVVNQMLSDLENQ